MIGNKRIPHFWAFVAAGALLTIFLGAPRKLSAQVTSSGLESNENAAIGGFSGADTLWADDATYSGVVYHRWFMNNNGFSTVPVAAWPCYSAANSGCIVVGASGSSGPYAESALTYSSVPNAFLQQGTATVRPAWSLYALPASIGAGGQLLNSTNATTSGFTSTPTLGTSGTTGTLILENTGTSTSTLTPAAGTASTNYTVTVPAVSGSLPVTADTTYLTTGFAEFHASAFTPVNNNFVPIFAGGAEQATETNAYSVAPRATTYHSLYVYQSISTQNVTYTFRFCTAIGSGCTNSALSCSIASGAQACNSTNAAGISVGVGNYMDTEFTSVTSGAAGVVSISYGYN